MSAEKKESDVPKNLHFPVELRMYISGGNVNVIARSSHPDLYHFTELNFPEADWNNLTVKAFKDTLKSKEWPSLNAGLYVLNWVPPLWLSISESGFRFYWWIWCLFFSSCWFSSYIF